jgi:Uma2 family endonuclease
MCREQEEAIAMVQIPARTDVEHQNLYPDSDGQPMADNTEQYQWIVRLVSNLRILFDGQPVFVAGDLLWYPVQVKPPREKAPCQAPDVMVVMGRPPGYRGSYKQWEEENIAPQVVFEILSPSNSASELTRKQNFYVQHGVLELYVYDPTSDEFWGLVREQLTEAPKLITPLNLPWKSPILGIQFKLSEDGLAVFYPDGQEFKTPEELGLERNQALQSLQQTQQERDQIQKQFTQSQEQLNRALAKLRELGINPDQL